jgi:acyl-coenzyme A thioesterase PaaI-like protein
MLAFNCTFLRPCGAADLRCHASVLNRTKRLAMARASLYAEGEEDAKADVSATYALRATVGPERTG